MSIELVGIRAQYRAGRARKATVVALDGVELFVDDGELLVVLGPSGSGKSTLLRVIAGLEQPGAGRVLLDGRDVTAVPPSRRDVAVVFQDQALFPHLSVEANVAFGLRARGADRASARRTALEVLDLLDMGRLAARRPTELSGGERQRVALARAVVRRPRAFLLDEPLSNLDAVARAAAREEIRQMQRRVGVSTVCVTHDPVEAMSLGDRIAVLRDRRVEQVASPDELYDRPATSCVALLIGMPPMNVVPGRVLGLDGRAPLAGVRPEHLAVCDPAEGRLRGTVDAVDRLGSDSILTVNIDGQRLRAVVARGLAPAPGTAVGLRFADGAVHRFDR